MYRFDESFAGGLFGFGRTYSAVLHFTFDNPEQLAADWAEAVLQVAAWRANRREKAHTLFIHIVADEDGIWAASHELTKRLLVSPADRAVELHGLRIEVGLFRLPDHDLVFDLILYPDCSS